MGLRLEMQGTFYWFKRREVNGKSKSTKSQRSRDINITESNMASHVFLSVSIVEKLKVTFGKGGATEVFVLAHIYVWNQ
jgi:hypothetical protein